MFAASYFTWGTTNILEVSWVISSLLAVYYTGKLVRRALKNLQWLRANNMNFAREDSARIMITVFGIFFLMAVAFTVAGLVAAVIPAVRQGTIHPLTAVISSIFILVNVILTTGSWFITRAQRMLVDKIERLEEERSKLDETRQERSGL